jgi:hypothetical protein
MEWVLFDPSHLSSPALSDAQAVPLLPSRITGREEGQGRWDGMEIERRGGFPFFCFSNENLVKSDQCSIEWRWTKAPGRGLESQSFQYHHSRLNGRFLP